MLRHSLRKVPSATQLRQAAPQSALRTIHNSGSAPKPSHLLSNGHNQYAALSVPSLKNECRQRGLRVSGRKSELIERLAAHEASRVFSTTAAVEAKGDDSHIDYFQVPPKKVERTKHKITIPVTPSTRASATEVETLAPEVPERTTPPNPAVTTVSEDTEVSSMNTDLGGVVKAEHADASEGDSNQISSRDKTFLLGLAAGIVAWWSSKSLQKSDKN